MNVVCIGAGRLAHHLMPELQRAGCAIKQVFNRSLHSARSLADKLHIADYTSDLTKIYPSADLYVLALSDDAINDVGSEIKKKQDLRGIVVHSSGVLGMDSIPFKLKGVFYPLQTFSEDHQIEWKSTPIVITSENEYVTNKLKDLAGKISNNVYEITDKQKTVLHLAAVFANNFTNHMLTIAENICEENKIPFEILKPLIQTTFEKALHHGASGSQTGPAVRGDDMTIDRHIQLLRDYPQLLEVYDAITKNIKIQASDALTGLKKSRH